MSATVTMPVRFQVGEGKVCEAGTVTMERGEDIRAVMAEFFHDLAAAFETAQEQGEVTDASADD